MGRIGVRRAGIGPALDRGLGNHGADERERVKQSGEVGEGQVGGDGQFVDPQGCVAQRLHQSPLIVVQTDLLDPEERCRIHDQGPADERPDGGIDLLLGGEAGHTEDHQLGYVDLEAGIQGVRYPRDPERAVMPGEDVQELADEILLKGLAQILGADHAALDEDVAEADAAGAALGEALLGHSLLDPAGAHHEAAERLMHQVGPALHRHSPLDDDLLGGRGAGHLQGRGPPAPGQRHHEFGDGLALEGPRFQMGDAFDVGLGQDHHRMVSGVGPLEPYQIRARTDPLCGGSNGLDRREDAMTCARFAQLASVVVRKVLLWAMVVGSGVSAVDAQIPELERPVTTSFGTYHPQLLQVEPRARWFEVAPGLANVHNAAQFDLPPEAIALLEEDGFFVATGRGAFYADRFSIGTAYQNFADVYLEAHEAGIPVFITSDVMLHVFHRLFDHVLMTTEEEFLLGETITLTSNLIDGLVHVRDDAGNPQTREIIDFACGHLAVGLRLLDPEASIPSWLETRVSEELGLIHAASGRELSPMFGAYWEDYSQYIPRGHYTRSEALERYFLGMMWFGRMTFALRGMGPFASSTEQRADLTAAALLLVRQLLVERGGLVEVDRWHTIYDPTHFMVGESDDLMYTHYADLAAEVYGAPLPLVAVETVCDPVLLQVFMDRAEAELPQPRIRGLAPQGLRLFGQRFIPDSWYFTELVHDSVDGRTMPSVLDVFSVLGSVAAEELQRSDGQEIYDGYVDQLLMLRSDVVGGPPERWASTLYWNWIYTLAPLLETWGEGFPPFMQSDAWPVRQLVTAAGSWTELRHDTILYAKQSYGSPTSSPPPGPPFSQGAVEPNPWVFARLGALARYARMGLGGQGILDESVATRLEALESASFLVADAAERELERRPLTNEQYLFIQRFGFWLGEVLDVDGGGGTISDDDDHSPVVADVHTDPDSASVLEEGTGYAGRIFVVCDVEGRLTLTVGAHFTHYEFAHPAADRMTDEMWWERLATDPPDLPWWTDGVYLNPWTPLASPDGAVGPPRQTEPVVDIVSSVVVPGQELQVECPIPGAVGWELVVDGVTVNSRTLPFSVENLSIPTSNLPLGDVTLMVHLEWGFAYAIRFRVVSFLPDVSEHVEASPAS
jgi:hypothetical protein